MTQIMTLPEFLSDEASRTGQSSGHVLDGIFAAFDAHSRKITARYQDPAIALALLQKTHADNVLEWDGYRRYIDGLRDKDDEWSRREVEAYDNEGNLPPASPVEVLQVVQVGHRRGFDGANGFFVARVRYEDRRVRLVRWEMTQTFGTATELPDRDDSITCLAEEIR